MTEFDMWFYHNLLIVLSVCGWVIVVSQLVMWFCNWKIKRLNAELKALKARGMKP